MGYTTEFQGSFKLNKPLDAETADYLRKFAETRRMARKLPKKFGVEGEFYAEGAGPFGQAHEDNVIDFNRPPKTQPSLWCQWVPNAKGTAIQWDGGEKFYSYVAWIEYLIKNFLAPKGYVLEGTVKFRGEDFGDTGAIVIKNNVVSKTGGER